MGERRHRRRREQLLAAVKEQAARQGIRLAPAQEIAARTLADVAADSGRSRRRRPGGVHLHGPAGRGKTWLADTIASASAERLGVRVRRLHFHRFLDDLHRAVHRHRGDPRHHAHAMESATDELIGGAELLVFDEFHVHDAGDAHFLTRLLRRTAATGRTTLIATSNYPPEDLLPNPLWHHLMEPGIALIRERMEVLDLDDGVDHRLREDDGEAPARGRAGFAAGGWLAPEALADAGLTAPTAAEADLVHAGSRVFEVLARRDGELWLSFAQLAEAPLSTREVLPWAAESACWVIVDVPRLESVDEEAQQRFITVVDILADQEVTTWFVSPVPRDRFLASAGDRPDAFRMVSRLGLLSEHGAGTAARGADGRRHEDQLLQRVETDGRRDPDHRRRVADDR